MLIKILSNRKIVVSASFILSFITLFLSSIINYTDYKCWYYIINPFENIFWFMKYITPELGNIGKGLVFLVILPSFFIILSLMLTSSRSKIFLSGIFLLVYYIGAQIYSLYVNNFSDFFAMEFVVKIGIMIFFIFELYLILIVVYNTRRFYAKNK